MIWTITLSSVLLGLAKPAAGYVCEGGYTAMENSKDCYRLFTTAQNYGEARAFCQKEGGDLASIHNAFDDAFIRSLGSDGKLIGLRYSESDDKYKWSDGTTLDYTNYVDGFEAHKEYLGYCAKQPNGKWQNAYCDEEFLPFVCQRPAANYTKTPNNVCPDSSIYYEDEGVLLSPGFPDKYVANMHCMYKLVAKLGYVIKLVLENLDVTYLTDFFPLNLGFRTDTTMVQLYRMEATGWEVILPTNKLLLEFYSLADSRGGTWKITWTSFRASPTKTSLPEVSVAALSSKNEYFQCAVGYTLSGDKCYRLVSGTALNYYEAVFHCREEGADLVSIHEAYVDTFLQQLISNVGEALIGLSYAGSGTYQWSDGTPVDYTNYDEDFLTMPEYLGCCAKLSSGKKWQNADCSEPLSFICKKKATNFTSTPSNECPNASTEYMNSGVLLSPGYPHNYTVAVTCIYELFAKKDRFIKITVDESDFSSDEYLYIFYLSNEKWLYAGIDCIEHKAAGTVLIVPHSHTRLEFHPKNTGRWRLTWEGIQKP